MALSAKQAGWTYGVVVVAGASALVQARDQQKEAAAAAERARSRQEALKRQAKLREESLRTRGV